MNEGPHPQRLATMTIQLDPFAATSDPPRRADVPIDPLHGLSAQLSDPCQCGWCAVVIGEGKGPHRAALFCSRCEGHRGWMANEAHSFIAECVKKFGKPTKPIRIRRNNAEGEQR
jgi:hypothetical protein